MLTGCRLPSCSPPPGASPADGPPAATSAAHGYSQATETGNAVHQQRQAAITLWQLAKGSRCGRHGFARSWPGTAACNDLPSTHLGHIHLRLLSRQHRLHPQAGAPPQLLPACSNAWGSSTCVGLRQAGRRRLFQRLPVRPSGASVAPSARRIVHNHARWCLVAGHSAPQVRRSDAVLAAGGTHRWARCKRLPWAAGRRCGRPRPQARRYRSRLPCSALCLLAAASQVHRCRRMDHHCSLQATRAGLHACPRRMGRRPAGGRRASPPR